MIKANKLIVRVLLIILSLTFAFGQISYAADTTLTLWAEYDVYSNLVEVKGASAGSWVTMYLLYPGKDVDDLPSDSPDSKVLAHIWQIPVTDGEYKYTFDPNVTVDGDYTVIVKAGFQMAKSTVYIGNGKIGNIYGLPTGTYDALSGDTTKERFEQAIASVPNEMPVYTPVEIDGELKIYVSAVSGDDKNDGTIENPLKTVKKAVELSKTKDISGGCVIYLRTGIYDNRQKIEVNGINSTTAHPYIITSYNNENVVFTDGYKLDASDLSDAVNELLIQKIPSDVRSDIKVIDLATYGIDEFASPDKIRLTIDDENYSLARWPNAATTKMREYTGADAVNGVIDPGSENGMEFCIEDIRPYTWQNTGDIMLVGSFNSEFWTDAVTLKSFNPEKRSIITKEVIKHNSAVGAKYSDKNSFHWVNIAEELDMPGEFYIDKASKKLYVYPINNINSNSEIILACSSEYSNGSVVAVNGNSNNIVINGINFKSNSKQKTASINNCRNVIMQNCTFKDSVGGILIGANTSFCGVINSSFENINGFYPIVTSKSAASEYVKELKPQYNFVQNNYFYDCSHIIIRGVGDIISHNYFSNIPGGAIYCDSSNEVIIEYNEIVSYGKTTDDCGAIYVGGRKDAAAGVYVRNNYIHDASPNAYDAASSRGIYLDDLNSNTYVYNNVLENAKTMFIHSGSDNTICNNIIINGGQRAISDSENHMKDTHVRLESIVPNYLVAGATHSKYLDETDADNYIDVLSENSPYRKRYPAMSEWSELLKKRMIEYRTSPETRGEGKSQYSQSYTNGKVVNLDYYIVSPRYNYYDRNVVVGDDYLSSLLNSALSITDTGKISAEIGTNKYYYKSSNPFEDGYTTSAYNAVRQKVPGFEDINVEKAGIIIASSDSDYTDNTYESYESLHEPRLLYPVNGAKVANEEVFSWKGSIGAAKYTLEISDTDNFSKVLYSNDTYSTSYMLEENLKEGSTYYWRVRATALSDKINGQEAVSDICWFVYGGTEDKMEICPVAYELNSDGLTTWLYNGTGTDYNKEIRIFAALYIGDGLGNVKFSQIPSAKADSIVGPYKVELDISEPYDYAKIFVWDNESVTPLSKSKIYLP